ncbi:ribulokinase [Gilvimarinus sp. SDUM040013]|uniref:Ribulokinase n=1 Tax=Gilvimarinus gilvus TaxID=3058038 RepID=A0ABU4RVQ4_9GAMM|nr:ribulokinase [Gilvimarinus sp. SDUM040013]MDO3387265.1 ribulokinase [Gilvimarinus sp. SDUM040013]MDX6848954.1 ribulokinase [Gilvimarinus sp. SDUM040013]
MVSYALGLDYGSDSVRALLVNTATGDEVASSVVNYPRWAKGLYCEPAQDQFRQHPLDYLESLEQVLANLWGEAPEGAAESVVGVSFDTTGSTPVAVDAEGVALALKPEFAENPNAMFVLWKDHTAVKEAAEFTEAASRSEPNYLKYEGGIYSSEWYWSKALHVMRADGSVKEAAHMWVEHCDWMTAVLTGTTHPSELRMGRCATGHKVMWHASWGGYPPNDFFAGVDPILDGFVDRLPAETFTADQAVGPLTSEWAAKLGLPAGIPIGFSAFDCHMGAVAANVQPGVLTKVMGTSTCDITIASAEVIGDTCVRGICGQVDGSVIPGMIGLEAGQSAFGDLYAWFKNFVNGPAKAIIEQSNALDAAAKSQLIAELEDKTLIELSNAATAIAPGQTGVTALDWVNGRRTPDADQTVAGAISGLKMGSDAAAVFRALVEATAFGARAIIERFREEGVAIDSVVAIGGISKKSDFVMQTCADVWNCPIDVLESDQSCALGAAIFAATVGGAHDSVASAQKAMGSSVCKTYQPKAEAARTYDALYENYKALGQYANGGVA